MSDDGWYCHPPGAPSRWAVLDVGLKCTHSCRTCFYAYMGDTEDPFYGMRHAKFHATDWLKLVVRAMRNNGFRGFDVSGGEPTIHPGIVDVIQHATDLGVASRIITLGQFFQRKDFDLLKRLLGAGLCDVNFSTHAHTEELFQKITGESLAKSEAAKDYLDGIGFRYSTNCTVSGMNYKFLPQIAANFVSHPGIYVVNFIQFMPLYQWQKHATEVEAPFGEVYPYLKEAVEMLTAAGKAVNIRYAPLCTMKGLERHHVGIVGVRYDPHEWNNCIDHYATDDADPELMGRYIDIRPGEAPGAALFPMRGKVGDHEVCAVRGASAQSPSKVFPLKCQGCAAMKVCDGIDGNYLMRHGDGELSPYEGVSRGSLLDRERLAYLPAFRVKTAPWAK